MKKMVDLRELELKSIVKNKPTMIYGTDNNDIMYIGIIDVLDNLSEKIKNSKDCEETKQYFELYLELIKVMKDVK